MELTHDFKISIPLPRLIQLFPMHPFSTPSKLQKTLWFFVFGGYTGCNWNKWCSGILIKRLIRKHRATTGLIYSMKTKLNLNRVVEGAKFQIDLNVI